VQTKQGASTRADVDLKIQNSALGMQVDCGYFESAGGDKWLTTKEVSYA
jgi:hypothetical protein